MATIRERKNGTVQIIVSAGFDENKKQIRKYMTYTPKETAKRKRDQEIQAVAKQFEEKVRYGESFEADKITFNDFLPIWERDWAKDKITEGTRLYYLQLMRLHVIPVIGHMKLSCINGAVLQRILNTLNQSGLSPATVKRVHTAMNSVFKYAVSLEVLSTNPCANRILPRSTKDRKLHYWEIDELQRFLTFLEMPYEVNKGNHKRTDSSGNKYDVTGYTVDYRVPLQFRAFFSLAVFGGLRCQELLALHWSDFDFDNNIVNITKAAGHLPHKQIEKSTKTPSSVRSIVIPDITVDILHLWKEEQTKHAYSIGTEWSGTTGKNYDDNYVFIQNNGQMMSLYTPGKKFQSIIERYNESIEKNALKIEDEEKREALLNLKLPVIRLHDLRHTSATLLISEGVDILTVSKRLGHSRVSTTLDIYSHAMESKDRTASEKFDALFNKAKKEEIAEGRYS